MLRIRRQGLSPRLLDHLLGRVSSRQIGADQLGLFADCLPTEPEVPEGKWFKRFPGMTVCGEGELVRTIAQLQRMWEVFALPAQATAFR